MSTTPETLPREAQFGGWPVTFRSLRAEDKELFKSFIRSLPRKDNYYLLVDVHDDQAINRWMSMVESGEVIGVIALEANHTRPSSALEIAAQLGISERSVYRVLQV